MMKYISILVFAAFLGWTWMVVHSTPDLSFETHSGIQEKLAQLIAETVKTRRPQASEIVIEKIWTEAGEKNQVKAFFVYSFKDVSEEGGTVTSRIEGDGILERQPSQDEKDLWKLTQVHTTNDSIQFDEVTVITGSAEGGEAAPAAAPAGGAHSEPTH